MAKSTIYSALDLCDGFYQSLMHESDIPLTAVSTPSGMLWEWLVMPQGLKNAGELPALELFQSGYTIVYRAGVTVNPRLTVRGVSFRHHCAMRAARLGG
ncbi:hypothetical protein PI124_g23111 [Phytophthora idaei]|nr:hypothetical protein PI125_g20737 [Phytophthora idaei]KAG3136567.1 hypothetical protein PI126_g17776 [Phytophthora idaei]KAG3231795.1 hypothetical protein PI124_g23111 [Phytophthora idaei]